MERLSFKIHVATPLFLSGANQQKVELRPPSIRGALRFWFRAMMEKFRHEGVDPS